MSDCILNIVSSHISIWIHSFLPREAAMLARSWDRNSVRLSVCLSVRPSVTRVLCDETKEHTADILIRVASHSSLLTPRDVGGLCPLPPEICA